VTANIKVWTEPYGSIESFDYMLPGDKAWRISGHSDGADEAEPFDDDARVWPLRALAMAEFDSGSIRAMRKIMDDLGDDVAPPGWRAALDTIERARKDAKPWPMMNGK